MTEDKNVSFALVALRMKVVTTTQVDEIWTKYLESPGQGFDRLFVEAGVLTDEQVGSVLENIDGEISKHGTVEIATESIIGESMAADTNANDTEASLVNETVNRLMGWQDAEMMTMDSVPEPEPESGSRQLTDELLFLVTAMELDLLSSLEMESLWMKVVDDELNAIDLVREQQMLTDEHILIVNQDIAKRKQDHQGETVAALRSLVDGEANQQLTDPNIIESLQSYVSIAEQAGIHMVDFCPNVDMSDMPETVDSQPITMDESRYTLTRVHGEGGLGRVWLARDGDLQREVAQKELRQNRADEEQSRRFVREAQITGQLEHPNIVPIYELTQLDNRVYYTMKFLRGETLQQEIKSYHRKLKKGEPTRLELRQLLSSCIAVCNAMAYAHDRSIIHRDLKPQNIMTGGFGEILVLDWGLAKRLGEVDSPKSTTISISEFADMEMTVEGQVIGTPAFMAPEQADGNQKLIGIETDIYGLGAILTGRPPHKSEPVTRRTHMMLAQISSGPTPRPREDLDSVPKPLDAICSKAMERLPEDRYESAADLAQDVRRWMADEPVSVFEESLFDRTRRWLRRHRTVAASSALALTVITIVSVIAAIYINNARNRVEVALKAESEALAAEKQALSDAETAREAERLAKVDATKRFAQAQEAVDEFLTGASDVLKYWPGGVTVRERLLEEAAERYQAFATESDDPELTFTAAVASIRLGDVFQMLNKRDEADSAYKKAQKVLIGLIEEFPDRQDTQLELGRCQTRMASMYARFGENDESTETYKQAIAVLEKLLDADNDNEDVREALALAYLNRGEGLIAQGQDADAEAVLMKAETYLERLAKLPSSERYQLGLASCNDKLARVLSATTE
ncbi:MAG: hypothetical protein CMJ78_09360 [Planctomycetaceae bacterium]|nr:hypothetical protein [Planctomycetaceae bacterium]